MLNSLRASASAGLSPESAASIGTSTGSAHERLEDWRFDRAIGTSADSTSERLEDWRFERALAWTPMLDSLCASASAGLSPASATSIGTSTGSAHERLEDRRDDWLEKATL